MNFLEILKIIRFNFEKVKLMKIESKKTWASKKGEIYRSTAIRSSFWGAKKKVQSVWFIDESYHVPYDTMVGDTIRQTIFVWHMAYLPRCEWLLTSTASGTDVFCNMLDVSVPAAVVVICWLLERLAKLAKCLITLVKPQTILTYSIYHWAIVGGLKD